MKKGPLFELIRISTLAKFTAVTVFNTSVIMLERCTAKGWINYHFGVPHRVMWSVSFIVGVCALFFHFLSKIYLSHCEEFDNINVNKTADNRLLAEYPLYVNFIKNEYGDAKGKRVAILYLALVQIGALTTSNRTDFYNFFLRTLDRSDKIDSFRKGVDKYLNTQGKPNSSEWLTTTITQSDIAPIVKKLSSLK